MIRVSISRVSPSKSIFKNPEDDLGSWSVKQIHKSHNGRFCEDCGVKIIKSLNVFADTGDEPVAVYKHLRWLQSPPESPGTIQKEQHYEQDRQYRSQGSTASALVQDVTNVTKLKTSFAQSETAALREENERLHIAVCQAVALMNIGDNQKAHLILRESLIPPQSTDTEKEK
jgi:hypothetical protein